MTFINPQKDFSLIAGVTYQNPHPPTPRILVIHWFGVSFPTHLNNIFHFINNLAPDYIQFMDISKSNLPLLPFKGILGVLRKEKVLNERH